MTYDMEIVLRDRQQAIIGRIALPEEPGGGERQPGDWTDSDVEQVLKQMLLAIDRAQNPGSGERYVALRGFSWIVEPADGGVVIAIEIPSGAVVAGPFDVAQTVLDASITRVLAAARHEQPTIH